MKAIARLLPFCALIVPGWALADESAKSQKFDSNGVSIRYTVEGKGEPVVLIHGLYSTADINWRAPGVIKLLAENHQVIALDLRGHGQSGKPDKEGSYGVEMAEDIDRLLGHLKIQQAQIVGYSLGGMVAMKFVTKHPDRVKSLILGGMGWLRAGSALQEFWGRIPEREGARTPSACVREMGNLAVTEDEIKLVHIPVAILVGDRDPCRRLYVAPLQRVRPDWPVTVIDQAGHLNCIFKPRFKEELKKQLDQQANH